MSWLIKFKYDNGDTDSIELNTDSVALASHILEDTCPLGWSLEGLMPVDNTLGDETVDADKLLAMANKARAQ